MIFADFYQCMANLTTSGLIFALSPLFLIVLILSSVVADRWHHKSVRLLNFVAAVLTAVVMAAVIYIGVQDVDKPEEPGTHIVVPDVIDIHIKDE